MPKGEKMKTKKLFYGVAITLILTLILVTIALASDVDVSVVDVTAPIGSVTLNQGQSAQIMINMTVTGNQAGTATFDVFKDWALSDGTFAGSNPQTFTVPPRAAQDPATTFSTTGTVSVDSGQAVGTFTLAVSAFNITNSNQTGAKLSDGLDSNYQITVTATSDNTPPVIIPNVSGTLGNNGWYVSDVTVSWTVSDPESAITSTSGCGPTTISTDNSGTTLTCSATSAGGTSSQSVTIKRDATAPTISAAVSPVRPASGWWNISSGAPTVTFTCDDATSGIASCTAPYTFTEGEDKSHSGMAVDNAGNSASDIVEDIDVDLTAPSVSASASPAANASGWNNTDVTVTYSGTDDLSGLASCDAPTVLSSEGTGQSATGSCTDLAGNSASATVSGINIDKTAPTISGASDRAANGNGWYNTDVTVSFTCGDALSGIASCSGPSTLGEGVSQSVTGNVTDLAGNSASATVSNINIDKTAPTISASASPAANLNGWNNGDVTVTYSGTDGLSGIDFCDAPTVLSDEGAGQSATGFCTDKAGNSASATVSDINIDKTPPSITWNGGPADGGVYYWGFVPEAGTCTASDALSGPGSCTVTGYGTEKGSYTMTATAYDLAGNKLEMHRYYTVNAWTLRGFFQPVDMNGVFNVVKGGSTVPLKFEIFAGPTELTDISYVKSLTYAQVACSTTAITDDIETLATGGTSLRYDSTAGQFVYNWKTPTTAGFCYRVTMTTQDGSSLVAYFKIK
jgi:hypothetical protein